MTPDEATVCVLALHRLLQENSCITRSAVQTALDMLMGRVRLERVAAPLPDLIHRFESEALTGLADDVSLSFYLDQLRVLLKRFQWNERVCRVLRMRVFPDIAASIEAVRGAFESMSQPAPLGDVLAFILWARSKVSIANVPNGKYITIPPQDGMLWEAGAEGLNDQGTGPCLVYWIKGDSVNELGILPIQSFLGGIGSEWTIVAFTPCPEPEDPKKSMLD